MAIKRGWIRTWGQYVPALNPPLTQSTNQVTNAFGPNPGVGEKATSLLRSRCWMELYVIAHAGTGGTISLDWVNETIMVYGLVGAIDGALPPAPLDAAAPAPPNFTDWMQWEYLIPHIEYTIATPAQALVTWRMPTGATDTQSRRLIAPPHSMSLYMNWSIQDGAGLINTVQPDGTTYKLGARFGGYFLTETKS